MPDSEQRYNEVAAEINRAVIKGDIDFRGAEIEKMHRMWQAVARELGWHYSREEV